MSRNMYDEYYMGQAGYGGGSGLPYYKGPPYMRGHGLGGLLSGVLRSTIVPMLKNTGKTLLREGIKTGTEILSDAIGGKSIKTSASERIGQSAQRLTKKATKRIKQRLNSTQSFLPPPPGIPIKRKRKNQTKKRSVRRKRDIFG